MIIQDIAGNNYKLDARRFSDIDIDRTIGRYVRLSSLTRTIWPVRYTCRPGIIVNFAPQFRDGNYEVGCRTFSKTIFNRIIRAAVAVRKTNKKKVARAKA